MGWGPQKCLALPGKIPLGGPENMVILVNRFKSIKKKKILASSFFFSYFFLQIKNLYNPLRFSLHMTQPSCHPNPVIYSKSTRQVILPPHTVPADDNKVQGQMKRKINIKAI